MRYIFVDFDGVLNTEKYQNDLRHKGLKTCDNYGPIFDPSAVECLCDIVAQVPDASIVIISSWKFEGEERMIQLWKDRNLPGVLSGITPTMIPMSLDDLYAGKGREIKSWLSTHPATHYVILDDVPDFLPEQMQHYIEINPIVGLTPEVVDQSVKILMSVYGKDK